MAIGGLHTDMHFRVRLTGSFSQTEAPHISGGFSCTDVQGNLYLKEKALYRSLRSTLRVDLIWPFPFTESETESEEFMGVAKGRELASRFLGLESSGSTDNSLYFLTICLLILNTSPISEWRLHLAYLLLVTCLFISGII